MPPPFTSYTKPAGLVKAADHPISNENGLAHSDAPDLIRQQGVQGKLWPITLKLFFALLAVAPGAWQLGSFQRAPPDRACSQKLRAASPVCYETLGGPDKE